MREPASPWTSFFLRLPKTWASKFGRFSSCPTARETAASKWRHTGAIRCASACISGKRFSRMAKPYLQHLNSSKDLETTYEAIRAGFVSLALEKNRRATPFVAEARALKAAASKAKTPTELL